MVNRRETASADAGRTPASLAEQVADAGDDGDYDLRWRRSLHGRAGAAAARMREGGNLRMSGSEKTKRKPWH
jgi:hypothetical protein